MNAAPTRDPLHLTALRGGIYLGAALLFAGPLANEPGMFAALAGVPGGLTLSRRLAESRLRSPVLAGLIAGMVLLGLAGIGLLGESAGLAHRLGTQLSLAVT